MRSLTRKELPHVRQKDYAFGPLHHPVPGHLCRRERHLRQFSARDALVVLVSRILLSAFLFGQALSLLYSLTGGLCSLCVMALVMKVLQKKLIFLTGAMGGLTHNLGQLAVAFAITRTAGVAAYLPFLILSGIVTGLFTGLCAGFAGRLLPPLPPDTV